MEWIEASWPAPPWVRAGCTTRLGGASAGRYASLNLGGHVGDDPACVARNRALLREYLCLPAEPLWLRQVHGCDVITAGAQLSPCGAGGEADAAVASEPGAVCAVLTADCLPLLLCDRAGTRVAAVHAGWRGLASGVIEAAVRRLGIAPENLLVWLGPAIGPDAFEVGDEVRAAFVAWDGAAAGAFRRSQAGRWWADLYGLARQRLQALGVDQAWGGGFCTKSDERRFFSYRRDGITGRMASLIWLASDPAAPPN